MFGINGGEFIVLLIVAAVVIGPERLPGYAEQLADLVRTARTMLRDAKNRVGEEFGDEVGDVDWAALDPRKYDPRRIVRDVLLEDEGLGLGAFALTEEGRRMGLPQPGRPGAGGAGSTTPAQRVAPLMQSVPSVNQTPSETTPHTDGQGPGPTGATRTTEGPDDVTSESVPDTRAPFDDEAT